jgi:ATP-dependent exoDNAse (exonuclease V) beta subunit
LIARFREQISAKAVSLLLHRDYYSVSNLLARGFPASVQRSKEPYELTAFRERSFAIRRDQEILTGSIDRLVVLARQGRPLAADIIDFKTDEIAPGDAQALQSKIDFYTPQLQAYRQAVRQMFGLPEQSIVARLAFLSLGRIAAIPAAAPQQIRSP